MDTQPSDAAIDAEIIAQTLQRGEGSICPSEVARALATEWRPLLNAVRHRAGVLSAAGQIDILRKGHRIEAEAIRGVIRLRQCRPPPRG